VESVRTEFYSLGKAGVVQNYTGLVVGGISADADGEIHRRVGIYTSGGMDNIFTGRTGFGTGSPAAQVQMSGDALFDGFSSGDLISDPAFDNSGTGFTFGAGWAFQNYTDTLGQWSEKWARHTPGSTAALTHTVTLNNSRYYVVVFTVKNATAGSVQFTMGGSGPQTAQNNQYNVYKIQPSSSADFTITPTSDFDGAIDDVHVYEYQPDAGRVNIFGRIGVNTLSPAESIDVKGNIIATGTITPSSDERLKTNITELSSVVDKVSTLKGVTYNWKQPENHGDDSSTQIGLIAQDVEKVFPKAVKTNSETGYKSLNYNGLVGVLVEAVKELKAEIEELKSQLNK
jgi:hypothetical protein